MPKFKITAPDGKAYVVTAPDGATQDQVMAFAQQHYGQQASAKTEPTVTVTAPDRLPGVLGTINDFGNDLGDALVHHLGNIPVGVAQAAAHYEQNVANAFLPSRERTLTSLITGDQGQPSGMVGKARGVLDRAVSGIDQYAANREKTYQQDVPDSAGSYLGATAGEVLPFLAGAGEARVAGIIPKAQTLLGRLGMAFAGGAAMGATQPVTGGDYNAGATQNTILGALAAPVAEAVGAGGSKLVSALRGGGSKVNPLDRAATDILTREAENPASLSKAAPSQVPGVTRTLAEETLDPGVARLERNLRSSNKSFDAIDRSNNAARVSSLDKIAGTDADYQAAQDARDTITGKLRKQSMLEGDIHDAALSQANTMRRAVAFGNQLSSTKGGLEGKINAIVAGNNGNPAVQSAVATVGKAIKDAGDSVGGLYNVRKYIGDLLSGRAGGDNSTAKAASRDLMQIRDAIDEELSNRAPTFSKYLTAYQDASKPINRMDIGRDLTDRSSGSAILDPVTGHQVLTPAQFSKKARDLDEVAARATGFGKAKAADILSPSDISTIKAIQDDLERQAFRATAGSGGNSQTFERQALQDRMARGVGREAMRHVPVVGRYAGDFLDMLDKSRNERVKERLAYLVANPAEARRVLASLPPAGQKIVNDALQGIGAPVGRIASSGSSQPSQ